MGWDFGSYESKQEFIDSLTQSYENEDAFYTCMEHKSYSGVMWSVWQRLDKKSGKASREIWCDLIKGSAPHFGHKAMSEAWGLFIILAPLNTWILCLIRNRNIAKDGEMRLGNFMRNVPRSDECGNKDYRLCLLS